MADSERKIQVVTSDIKSFDGSRFRFAAQAQKHFQFILFLLVQNALV